MLKLIILSILVVSQSVSANTEAVQTFVYEGRLYDSLESPMSESVTFRVEILNQAENCLLYEEVQVKDLSSSQGRFNLEIGSAAGATKRSTDDPGFSMWQVFKNTGSLAVPASVCPGTPYNPAIGEKRKLRVSITPSSTGIEETLSPNQSITSAPSAIMSQSLQGIGKDGFIQVNSNVTQANAALLTGGSDIGSSLHNHDSIYAQINNSGSMTFGAGETLGLGSFTNATETTMTGGLAAGDAGKTWYNSDTGAVKYWDGNSVETLSAGAGISSINGHSGSTQTFTTPGTSGTAPNWDFSVANQHLLNIPMASAASVVAGLLSNADYGTFSSKIGSSDNPNAAGDISGSFGAGLIIANDAVTSAMILDGQVDTADLANASVTTAKLVDGSVTLPKLSGTGAIALQAIRRNAGNTAWEYYTPTDSDTTYTADGNGLELGGTVFSIELEDGSLAKSATGLKVGAIGSSHVTDNSLTDADINSSAGILRTKLAAGTASMVLVNNGSGVMSESPIIDNTELSYLDNVTSNIQTQLNAKQSSLGFTPVNKAGDNMTSHLNMDTQSQIRFADAVGGEFASIHAPATIPSSYILVLPPNDGDAGQVLTTDGSGVLSWQTNGGDVPSTRNLTAGSGLSGGGTLAADLTFNIGAGTGIIVAADTIAVDVGTTANKIVQLDGSGRLPAVDGSLLTNVSGLADTSVTAGSYGSASSVATFTVDAKGRLTAASNTAIGSLNTSVLTAGTLAAARMPALTGDVTTSAGAVATTIAANAVTSAKILDGTIVSADIADGTIASADLASSISAGLWTESSGDVYRSSGNVGIGTASPASVLHTVAPTNTSTSGANYGHRFTGSVNPSAASTASNYNVYNYSNMTGANDVTSHIGEYTLTDHNGTGTVTNLYGQMTYARNLSSGTVSSLRGNYAYAYNNADGLVSNAYGLFGLVNNVNAAGTITNAYGVYADINITAGTITNAYGVFIPDIAGTNQYGIYQQNSTDTNYFAGNVGIGTAAPAQKLDVVGGVQATAYYYTSDRRLKTEIEDIEGLEHILKMRGVTFNWIKDGTPEVGLIAQEVESVIPELVYTNPETGFKSVKYGNIVAPLIESVKELYEMNVSLQDQVAQQDRRISSLEEEKEQLEDRMKNLELQMNALMEKFQK